MSKMLEHPDITRALRTGHHNADPERPTCPNCGSECETVYLDENQYALGCNKCVRAVDAWEYQHGEDEDDE